MSDRALPKHDVPSLLVPISDLMPSGESLRRGPVYDTIKEARREDDPKLDHGIWQTEPKAADWDSVIRIAVEALQKKSKDLRVAGWLTEAWTCKYGVPGCTHGIQLLRGLVEQFWDTLHPPLDDDGDLEGRLAPFGWMNGQLAVRIKQIPLTEPRERNHIRLNLVTWERSSLLERSGKTAGSADISTADFMTAVLLTPTPVYRQLSADLDVLREAIQALEDALDTRCGQPVAAFYQLKEAVDAVRHFVRRALDQKGDTDAAPAEADADVGEETAAVSDDDDLAGAPGRRGPIRNRAEAYQRLAEAADYLIQKEPHSPVPHLIKRAVAWGNMPFPDLIQELVHDRNNLGAIYSLLGLGNPNQR